VSKNNMVNPQKLSKDLETASKKISSQFIRSKNFSSPFHPNTSYVLTILIPNNNTRQNAK
jgi:hypothetical protein